MSYATDFIRYLKAFNINNFTHRDILIQTTANCPYSVLPDIKIILSKEGKQLREEEEIKNKKRYKRYFIEVI